MGNTLGDNDGTADGADVGDRVLGLTVGAFEPPDNVGSDVTGNTLGNTLGNIDGIVVGDNCGAKEGFELGDTDGNMLGDIDGLELGALGLV